MSDPTAAFTRFVPGFDFLQGLVKNAGAALPGVGQWIAPTLDPAELDKRIEELRTVQFWLEQNARLLGTTIQALEVQRMTLSTLKTMNLSMGELAESLKIRMPEPAAAPPPQADAAMRSPRPAAAPAATPAPPPAPPPAAAVPQGVVDPMQWWGALTQQFTEIAAGAMKDSSAEAAKHLADAMVKQGFDAAGKTLKGAAGMPMAAAKSAASAASAAMKAAVGAAGRAAVPGAGKAAGKAAPRPARKTARRG